MDLFEKTRKSNNFNSLEKIRGIILVTDDWTTLDLITSSFKKKRH